jgi:hypothetical protein
MTPLLMTLAGILPGDGGPGGGAAREPVAVKLGEGLKGFIRLPGGPLYRAAVAGRHFYLREGAGPNVIPFAGCTLAGDGTGRFRLTWREQVYRGRARSTPGGVELVLDPIPTGPPPSRPWMTLPALLQGPTIPPP